MEITGGMRSEYAAWHSQGIMPQDFKPSRREEKYFGPEKMNTIAVGESQTAPWQTAELITTPVPCAGHILKYCAKWENSLGLINFELLYKFQNSLFFLRLRIMEKYIYPSEIYIYSQLYIGLSISYLGSLDN